jgi:AmiR/NasT family two-component response regulator
MRSNSLSSLQGKRIVIVEDEGVTIMQVRMGLLAAGMEVVGVAVTGQQAIDCVFKERPDIVLIDIDLQGGIDGLNAAQSILTIYPVCIVILTAYADPQHRVQAADLAICGYIVKPVDAAKIVSELEQAYSDWQHRCT